MTNWLKIPAAIFFLAAFGARPTVAAILFGMATLCLLGSHYWDKKHPKS